MLSQCMDQPTLLSRKGSSIRSASIPVQAPSSSHSQPVATAVKTSTQGLSGRTSVTASTPSASTPATLPSASVYSGSASSSLAGSSTSYQPSTPYSNTLTAGSSAHWPSAAAPYSQPLTISTGPPTGVGSVAPTATPGYGAPSFAPAAQPANVMYAPSYHQHIHHHHHHPMPHPYEFPPHGMVFERRGHGSYRSCSSRCYSPCYSSDDSDSGWDSDSSR